MITNTLNTSTGIVVDEFGDTGAVRLVPIHGEKPGQPLILDVDAADQLAKQLRLIVDTARGKAAIYGGTV